MTNTTNTIALTDAQERRYEAFCDRHGLDAMLDAHEQLSLLRGLGDTHACAILSGIITPHESAITRQKRESLLNTVIDIVVSTEPVRSLVIWCASQPREAVVNATRTKGGQIQLGLAF